MSIAGPIDETDGAAGRPRPSRRDVLGAAMAGSAGIAGGRLFALGQEQVALVQRTLRGTKATGTDWISPLGSEQARVAHLLRRTTFGATLADLERASSDGYAKTVDRLLESRPAAPPDLPAA